MNNKTKIIIAVVSVVVIGAGIFFLGGNNTMADMTALEKLEASMEKQVEVKKVDMDMTIGLDFDIDETVEGVDTSMLNVIEDIEFVYNIKEDISDVENFLMEGLFSVMYQGETSMDMNFFMDAEKMVFGIPFLYENSFYMTYEGYASLMEKTLNMSGQGTESATDFSFDMKKIMNDSIEFSEKFYSLEGIEGAENFDGDKYRTMMEEGLSGILTETEAFDVEIDNEGEVSTIECDGFMLTFNETQFIDFALPILEEAKTDEALKNIIIAKTQEYFDFAIGVYGEDFFNQPGMDDPYGEINEFIEEIKTNYEIRIGEMITGLQTQRERSEMETFVAINKIGLDSDGEMRYWDMSLDLNIEALEDIESAAMEGIDGAVIPEMSNSEGIKGVNVSMVYVINSINEELIFTDYSTVTETGVDIVAVAENLESPEAQSLMMQIMGAGMQEMGTNPLLQILSQNMGQGVY
jgi:hypothetical protein